MALVVPNIGEAIALEYLVNRTTTYANRENLVLRLYTNDYTCVEGSTAANFTEASGNGYSSITLTGNSWNAATTGDPTYVDYAQQTFTFTGALGNVYGYYLTRLTGTELVYAERFSDGPYNVQNNGDQIKITPRIEAS